jgi:hypothetical protein
MLMQARQRIWRMKEAFPMIQSAVGRGRWNVDPCAARRLTDDSSSADVYLMASAASLG